MTEHRNAITARNVQVAPLPLLAMVLLLAGLGSGPSAQAQEASPLARVEALGLDTARVGRVTVYFAPADRGRALELATLAEGAAAHFERELGISFEFGVAALTPEQWFSEFPGVPYAIPWVSMPDRLLFVPSSLSEGFMVRGPTPLHDRRRIDAGLLHEYGHLVEKAYLRPESEQNQLPGAWFGELLANYLAYAYISSADPEWAEAAKAMRRAVVEGYTPSVLSLEWGFMNELPPEELARTYAWYQNLLVLRAAALYEAQGLCFLRALRDRLGKDPGSWTTASLLPLLEEVAPGFDAWANDLTGATGGSGAVARTMPAGTGGAAETAETLLALAEEWLDSWNALDPERMLQFYDEDLLYYWKGRPMTLGQFESALHEYIIPNETYSIELTEPHVQLIGADAAVVAFIWGDKAGPSGEVPPPIAAVSLVFERRGGVWKILHIHESPVSR
jgi:uncharacterized protein (TIGR02246 family)